MDSDTCLAYEDPYNQGGGSSPSPSPSVSPGPATITKQQAFQIIKDYNLSLSAQMDKLDDRNTFFQDYFLASNQYKKLPQNIKDAIKVYLGR